MLFVILAPIVYGLLCWIPVLIFFRVTRPFSKDFKLTLLKSVPQFFIADKLAILTLVSLTLGSSQFMWMDERLDLPAMIFFLGLVLGTGWIAIHSLNKHGVESSLPRGLFLAVALPASLAASFALAWTSCGMIFPFVRAESSVAFLLAIMLVSVGALALVAWYCRWMFRNFGKGAMEIVEPGKETSSRK